MYIKQILIIGSGDNLIETTEGFGFKGKFDLDQLAPTLSFNLPYLLPGQFSLGGTTVDLTRLKKYDTVQLYFGEFAQDPGVVTTDQLIKVFDGYIENINLSKTKQSIDYSITAYGTAGLFNSRGAFYEITSAPLGVLMRRLIEGGNLQDIVPLRFLNIQNENLGVIIDGGKNLKDVVDQIKEKYAVIITQSGDGFLNVYTPSFLQENNGSTGREAWQFNLQEGNVFEIDYGDLTSNLNAVVVMGYPPSVGIAIDVLGVENNAGEINYQTYERPDLFGIEDCEAFAREKLLEQQRNFVLSFKTKFNPLFQVGQSFQLADQDRFTGQEIFTLKSYEFTIDKNDVSCKIEGFTFSLTVLPENFVLSNTGIADVDIIGLRPKQEGLITQGTLQ